MIASIEKLQPTGQNLGRVLNSRSGCLCALQLSCFETKFANLMLKTRLKQLVRSLLLDIALQVPSNQDHLQQSTQACQLLRRNVYTFFTLPL
jgi:hypothetical protein